MRMEGAIFDLDGTLLDSMRVWSSLGADYLISRGVRPRGDIGEVFKPLSLRQAAEYYIREYGLTDAVEEIEAGVKRMVERFYYETVGPMPGAERLLAELERRGVPMCVATATDRALAEAALRRCGLLRRFRAVLTCAEAGAGKDRPDIYMAALGRLGTRIESTVVIEDAPYAIKTAKEAGFTVVGMLDGAGYWRAEDVAAAADICVSNLCQILELLD